MGISSVHQAVSANNLQCLTSLVKHGASVTCTDKRGLLPLDVSKVPEMRIHTSLINLRGSAEAAAQDPDCCCGLRDGVWGHTACSKYLQNVMWFEKKREEERERRKWVAEHKKLLETEIRKYSEIRQSEKVENAYKSWTKRKGVSPPKLPTNCAVRAKSMRCIDPSPPVPSFHRSQMSKKCSEKLSVTTPRPVSPGGSPRVQFERVKKIQELRRTLTARDIMGQTRSRDTSSPQPQPLLSATPKAADFQPPIPLVKQVRLIREQEIHDRISKLAQPKVLRPRKRKKHSAVVSTVPKHSSTEPFVVKVDNYFKVNTEPDTPTPDSGFSEVSSTNVKSPESPEGEQEEEPLDLSVQSVDGDEEQIYRPGLGSLTISPSKSVRFNQRVYFNTETKPMPFYKGVDELRSCIKRGLSLKA
eukprot:sb/3465122/